ncbi:MAG: Gfo/Idh/MocA family oxidoreductase [Rhodospirillales bacterium]
MIRIAILQANSSHPEAFISIINGPDSLFRDRARVVTIWDEDINLSTAQASHDVRACATLDEAIDNVDLVMICGRWGDQHPDLAIRVAGRVQAVFIDKPLAASFSRACDVVDAFEASGTPALCASAYRFAPEVLSFCEGLDRLGDFRSGQAAGLSEWPDLGPKGRELHFYGVHTAEMIQTVFGEGIRSVLVHPGDGADIAILEFADGRRVDWHLLRDCAEIYEVGCYGMKGHDRVRIDPFSAYYENMMEAAVRMAETGKSPVSLRASAEIVALLDAVTLARGTPGERLALRVRTDRTGKI